jgi:hypothetical protein
MTINFSTGEVLVYNKRCVLLTAVTEFLKRT